MKKGLLTYLIAEAGGFYLGFHSKSYWDLFGSLVTTIVVIGLFAIVRKIAKKDPVLQKSAMLSRTMDLVDK